MLQSLVWRYVWQSQSTSDGHTITMDDSNAFCAPSSSPGRVFEHNGIPNHHISLSRNRWEKSLEEAYEGWNGETQAGGEPSAVKEQGRGGSNLGGLFRRPGVVYPILPTGHMRLPRSSSRSSFSGEDVEDGGKHFITFVVQVGVDSGRRSPTCHRLL